MSLEDFFDVHTFAWTLINFVLFMLVLKYLILNPLLKTMKARQEKMDNFDKICLAEAEEALKQKAVTETEETKRNAVLKANADAAYEEALKKHREELEAAEAEYEKALKKAEAAACAESASITAAVKEKLPLLTESFLSRMTPKDDNYVS